MALQKNAASKPAPQEKSTPKPETAAPAPELATPKETAPKISRKELAASIRAKVTTAGAAISEKVANIVAVAFEESIAESLESGHQVVLPGFGQFSSSLRPESIKKSPQTGEEITVKAYRAVKFKAGSKLKARVNAGMSVEELPEDE